MTTRVVGTAGLLVCIGFLVTGCSSTTKTQHTDSYDAAWPDDVLDHAAHQREVTIVIALSSVVPAGVIGHAGIAVDDRYWDFGPQRVHKHQRLKAFNSQAGPWWDDPEQRWTADRTLGEVLSDLPDKVHPIGSLIAIVRVQVTDKQADAIATFWQDTYARMVHGEDRYRLRGRQCANMVAWSIAAAMDGEPRTRDRLPGELRLMTPTRLYETLRRTLCHTAGECVGQPADVSFWQLGPDGVRPWRRPAVWDRLGVVELPRTRLAFERVKHLPHAWIRR